MEKAKQNPENYPDQKSKANHYYGQYPFIIITDFYNHDVSIQGLVTYGYEKFEKCESVASTLPTPRVVAGKGTHRCPPVPPAFAAVVGAS